MKILRAVLVILEMSLFAIGAMFIGCVMFPVLL